MFDYLALELGPTRENDSLIKIELARDADGDSTSVRVDKHEWQKDKVYFGEQRATA